MLSNWHIPDHSVRSYDLKYEFKEICINLYVYLQKWKKNPDIWYFQNQTLEKAGRWEKGSYSHCVL